MPATHSHVATNPSGLIVILYGGLGVCLLGYLWARLSFDFWTLVDWLHSSHSRASRLGGQRRKRSGIQRKVLRIDYLRGMLAQQSSCFSRKCAVGADKPSIRPRVVGAQNVGKHWTGFRSQITCRLGATRYAPQIIGIDAILFWAANVWRWEIETLCWA